MTDENQQGVLKKFGFDFDSENYKSVIFVAELIPASNAKYINRKTLMKSVNLQVNSSRLWPG